MRGGFGFHYVKTGSIQMSEFESNHQIRLVHNWPSGGVHQNRSSLHAGESGSVNQMTRLLSERSMQRQDIGASEQIFKRRRAFQAKGFFNPVGQIGVMKDGLESKCFGAESCGSANPSASQNAKYLSPASADGPCRSPVPDPFLNFRPGLAEIPHEIKRQT